MSLRHFRTISAFGAVLLLLSFPAHLAASSSVVECGQITGFTAPDPVAPDDGALTIGFLPPWVIAPDATLSASVVANLLSIVNTGPSCLAMDLDDGEVITALDFASQGDVAGEVVFDSGFGGYVFADRLLVPTFITDAYPGLAGTFVTSAAAGTEASATFFVDTTTGQFTGVDVMAGFCGPADLAGNGDGTIGVATIPAVLLDAADTAALAAADSGQACASVRSQGTIANENGELSITTDVTITLDAHVTASAPSSVELPTPPATSTRDLDASPSRPDSRIVGFALLLALFALGALGRARNRSS